ncbi:hypothetical protein HJFPF1_01179 [Paramyrothecium foliicola]|nr:hypothetical protein HJFPF1_01179 [Paramyrothecium foliicola]
MGWLSSIFGTEKSDDPLGKLDPNLRDFLKKESPVKYTPSQSSQQPTPAPGPQDGSQPTANEGPVAPSESLYKDGRYAHLWKTYRPLAQVEAETSSDQEKLTGILDAFKERKESIAQAAMENCALQQEEWVNCMKSGSWEDRMQMCRHQVRRFERCYTMQSRFLRVLGYGSVIGRPAQVDEDIQMHSDSLFQRMLLHEQAVEKAKKEGTPIPVFDLSLPKPSASTVAPSEEIQKQWKEKLDQLPEDERKVEEAALRADLQVKTTVARDMKKIWDTKHEEREARQAEGQGTLSDSLASLVFGKGNK